MYICKYRYIYKLMHMRVYIYRHIYVNTHVYICVCVCVCVCEWLSESACAGNNDMMQQYHRCSCYFKLFFMTEICNKRNFYSGITALCSVSQCVAVGCSVVQCDVVWCRVMQCDVVWRSVLQCVAVLCSIVFYDWNLLHANLLLLRCLKLQVFFHKRATNYIALLQKMNYEDKASYDSTPPCITSLQGADHSRVLQRVAACCSVLQNFAMCCNMLPCVAVRSHTRDQQRANLLPRHYIPKHDPCSMLQRVAISVLQYSAVRYSVLQYEPEVRNERISSSSVITFPNKIPGSPRAMCRSTCPVLSLVESRRAMT